MSQLREVADDYLRMRRTLGYKLELAGWHLGKFVTYLEQADATTVTIGNALTWATSAGNDPSYWAHRLSIVRQFARHLQTIDPACEVPPAQLLPYRAPRAIPYLYEPEQIVALMRAAGALEPALLAANYQTLIGLLAVTGMRLGEAIRLDRDDVDNDHGLLRILDSKFGKSREVVVHDTTARPRSDTHDFVTGGFRSRAARRSWSPCAAPGCAATASITCVPPAYANRRTCCSLAALPTSAPRSDTCFRCQDAARVVPRRRRCPSPAAAALHLPGACQPGEHVLVPDRRP